MSLNERFKKEIVPELARTLVISNLLAVPRPTRVVVNMGLGRAKDTKGLLAEAQADLARITGQQPNVRRARRDEAGWSLRQGDPIGLAVTLRGEKMWDFLEKLVRVVLPRVRDFHGLEKSSFDGCGNYSIGFEEHTCFPEIDPNEVGVLRGLEVTIVTNAREDEGGYQLLKALGVPFKEQTS